MRSLLVGREREERRLDELLAGACSGDGAFVLLSGEAGVGETRLASSLARRAGVPVLRGAAVQDRTPPYGPLVAVLRSFPHTHPRGLDDCGPLGRHLALLLPELGDAPARADRASVFEALRCTLAAIGPALVVLDDLQWSDEATLEVLRALAEPLRTLPLLVLAVYRSDGLPRTHGVRRLRLELRRAGHLDEIALRPLEPEATAELLAGALGDRPAASLADAIHDRTQVVSRSGLREPVAGVQSVAGDVTDPAFAASATHGARVVYQALNPPYHRWAQEFPGLQAAAIAAAQTAGARLVVMDNVYMYGRADGRPFTEERAYDAHTRKGRVRAAMARDLMAAHEAGRVQVTVGRASDFFGPRAGGQSLIGDWVIPPALADQTASVMGDPDMPHTYTFIPDIGENLVGLGEHDDALGRVWHLPSPETRTTREVVALVYQAVGTRPRLKVTPAWQMRALGLVNRTVREVNEMRYEFDEPFIVDASRAETELGLCATPLADAIEQTVRWYRAQTSPSSAAEQKRTDEVAPG